MRWRRWAQTLRRRHARRDRRSAATGLVLVRSRAPLAQVRVALSPITLALCVRLQVRRAAVPSVVPALQRSTGAPMAWPFAPRLAAIRPAPSPAAATPPAVAAAGHSAAPRFVRIATWFAQPASLAASSPPPVAIPMPPAASPAIVHRARAFSARAHQRGARRDLVLPPPARVLATTASAGRTEPSRQVAMPAVPPLPAPSSRDALASAALPAVNVEALTSQVIQQLDRRFTAYRERMGRA